MARRDRDAPTELLILVKAARTIPMAFHPGAVPCSTAFLPWNIVQT
jgi:hypothetical protein